jgi:hypothetical protein
MERGHSFDYMQTDKDFFSPEYIRHILVKLRPWKGLVLISRLVFTDGERWRRRFCCFCLSQGGTDATLDCGLRRWPEVGFGDIIRWFPRSPFPDNFRFADNPGIGPSEDHKCVSPYLSGETSHKRIFWPGVAARVNTRVRNATRQGPTYARPVHALGITRRGSRATLRAGSGYVPRPEKGMRHFRHC